MRKALLFVSAPLLFTMACANKEPAPVKQSTAVSAAALKPSEPATPPKPKPLPDGAYRAELTLASSASASVSKGALVKFTVHVRNTGTGTYPSKPSAAGLRDCVALSYHLLSAKDKAPVVFDGVRALLPADLPPGAAVDLPIEVKVPDAPGAYILQFDLVHEDIVWFAAKQSAILSVSLKVV